MIYHFMIHIPTYTYDIPRPLAQLRVSFAARTSGFRAVQCNVEARPGKAYIYIYMHVYIYIYICMHVCI